MKPARLHIDAVALALVSAIVLLGLIMVTSASISIASRNGGDAFSFLERQLVLCLVGGLLAAMVFCVRTEYIEKMAWPLLILAAVLLFVVLIPGLGHMVNGSRRWIRVLGFNFQASELARVLVLIFIASYAVRREDELRSTALGLIKPMALLGFVALLLLAEPDFGAASVLLVAGFGILFVAGARLRWVLLVAAVCAGALALLVVMAPYRMARVTSFLDPWADPFNSGFQLTQSLIAIGRGEWFGVGLGESVQKLFYLPEAHTDFLFAVLAEELGLVGVALTLALFIGLVWRSFWIAQLASRANLRFQAYLAAGFGIWLGCQALINIGVNMGVLPTKGLTLPLMSYGRSSMIVTLAWVGLLLRVYHETMQSGRGMATLRRSEGGRSDEDPQPRGTRLARSAA
jgi:cell division protein FtsW